MVRDEADIIEHTIRHLFAHGIDYAIVADNMSTDDTRAILECLAVEFPLTVVDDKEPGYYQADKMTALAAQAMALGATWVLPFDADELWYVKSGETLAEWFSACSADVVHAAGYDHVAKRDVLGNPFDQMPWRRAYTQTFPKVAFRRYEGARIGMGNHETDRPGIVTTGLAYRHFQYRSFEQLLRKVRNGAKAYAATNLDETYGAHWRQAGQLDEDALARWWRNLCEADGLVYDPAPVTP
jgi:hypothetical protein